MKNFFRLPQWMLAAVVTAGACSAAAAENCEPSGGISFLCGPAAVEDLVRIPGTQWIVGSGMAERGNPGRLHIIDAGKKTWGVLYPAPDAAVEQDSSSFPACPGPPDEKTFGAHGIAVRMDGSEATILAVNHGREAIEVFRLRVSGAKPAIRWKGCVPMGGSNYINSVAFLPDGGFVATKFFDPKDPAGFRSIFAGGVTGGVLEWHSKTGVKALAGTEVAGANGIEVSKDGEWIYVAAWGSEEVVRFARSGVPPARQTAKVGFAPDNLRWAPDGDLFVAGQNMKAGSPGGFPSFKGWTVVKLDPKALKFTELAKDDGGSPMQNVSVAIEVDGTLWLGQFAGDRIGYKKLSENR